MDEERPRGYVLLPGLDGTGELFGRFAALLSAAGQSHTVVRLPTASVGSYAELADRVAPTLDMTGKVIVAESFSGPLALELAARQGADTLAGMVLVASFVRSPVSMLHGLLPWPTIFRRRPPTWAIRRYLVGPQASLGLVNEVRDAVATVPASLLAERVRLILGVNVEQKLQSCRTSIVYLQATRDRLVGRRSVDQILKAREDVVVHRVDAAHLLLQTAPDAAWAAIQRCFS